MSLKLLMRTRILLDIYPASPFNNPNQIQPAVEVLYVLKTWLHKVRIFMYYLVSIYTLPIDVGKVRFNHIGYDL